jgi:hypothetical protein
MEADDDASIKTDYFYVCACGNCSELFLTCSEHGETSECLSIDEDTDEVLKIVSNLDLILASMSTNQSTIDKNKLNKLREHIEDLDKHCVQCSQNTNKSNKTHFLSSSNFEKSISIIQKQIEKLSRRVHEVCQILKSTEFENNLKHPNFPPVIHVTSNHTNRIPNQTVDKIKPYTSINAKESKVEKTNLMNSMPVSKQKYKTLARDVTLDFDQDKKLKFTKIYPKMDCPSHTVDIEKSKKFQNFMNYPKCDFDNRFQSVPGIGVVYSERLVKYIATVFELINAATSMEKHDFKALMKCYANVNSHYSELIYLSMLAHHRKFGCEQTSTK